MKGYSLQAEHPTHFEVSHPKEGVFKVAKGHLDEKTIKKIRGMPKKKGYADGGEVTGDAVPPLTEGGNNPTMVDPRQIPPMPGQSSTDLFNAPMVSRAAAAPDTIPPERSAANATPEELGALAKKLKSDEAAAPKINPNAAPANPPPQSGMQTVGMPGASGGAALPPMEDYSGDISKIAAGIRAGAGAQSAAQKEIENAVIEQQKQRKIAQDNYQASLVKNEQDHKQIIQGIMDQKIDPNRVWQNVTTGNKVMAAIGMMLSGIGSGLSGQPNMAMKVIDESIARDIDAQKAELGKKETLLSDNLRKYGNINEAYHVTSMQMNSVVEGQIRLAQAKASGASAQAAAQVQLAELGMRQKQMSAQLAYQRANMNAYLGMGDGGGGSGSAVAAGIDPGRIRAGLASGMIPEKAAEPIAKEYGEHMKLQKDLANVGQAFDQSAALQTWSARGGDPIQAKTKIEANSQFYAAELAKDLAGRVSEADLPIYMKNMPEFSDDQSTLATKRRNITDSIKAKANFPNLRMYGLINPNDPSLTTISQGQQRGQGRDFIPTGGQ